MVAWSICLWMPGVWFGRQGGSHENVIYARKLSFVGAFSFERTSSLREQGILNQRSLGTSFLTFLDLENQRKKELL